MIEEITIKFDMKLKLIKASWKSQLYNLYGKKLHLPLLGKKPDGMKDEEWNLLDRHVPGVIRLTLSRSVIHNFMKEKTIVDLMKTFSSMYKKPSANNKVHLMKKLFNLKDGGSYSCGTASK